jgi:hypothetical protein
MQHGQTSPLETQEAKHQLTRVSSDPQSSKIELARLPCSRSAAKPRKPRMFSHVFFYGLHDASIATRIFTKEELKIIEVFTKISPHIVP